MNRPHVLTIGHSSHPIERFIALLRQHGVTAIADVRSSPYSRMNPQYNRQSLQRELQAVGIAYVFLGKELGARSDNRSCYKDGRLQYGRLAQTALFKQGLQRVQKGAESHRVALMCAEKEPLDCHRTLLVSRVLKVEGVDVSHIHADGSLESNPNAMRRLLEVVGISPSDLFKSEHELIAEACARHEEQIAYVNEDMRGTDN